MATARPLVRAPELEGAGWVNAPAALSLADLRGRVVILDFWTLSCVNCLHVVEELRELEVAFPEELVVVGVHSPKFAYEASHEAVRRAVARHRIDHPVLDDPELRTWHRYAVRAWPTLVIIDPAGYVAGAVAGEGHSDALAAAVERLVAEAEEEGTLRRGEVPYTVSEEPHHALRFPGKVASDGAGRLAIADTGRDRVIVTDLGGSVLREHRLLEQPQGVRFEGEDVLVCESTGDQVWRVGADDSRTLVADGISSPWDVVREDERLVVCEAGRHRLWAVDALGSRPVAGTAAEDLRDGLAPDALLAQPSGVAALPDGGVAFADSEASALRVLREERVETLVGQGLFEWGSADGGIDEARLQHPLGVAAAPDGTIYVADTFNGLLRAWRAGRLETLPVPGLLEPGGLDVLPDGRLVVADTGNHRVVLVEPATGAVEDLSIHGAMDLPDDAASGPLASPPAPGFPARAGIEDLGHLELASASTWQLDLDLDLDLDLEGERLDAGAGPPVRLSVSADPPSLLGPGSTGWGLAGLPARGEVTLGAPGEVGVLEAELRVATCSPDECRVRERRVRERRVRWHVSLS